MPIVSSTYTVDHAQIDGRKYVAELHTDSDGKVHRCEYLAPADWTTTEYDAKLSERATAISARLAQQEIDEVLNGD